MLQLVSCMGHIRNQFHYCFTRLLDVWTTFYVIPTADVMTLTHIKATLERNNVSIINGFVLMPSNEMAIFL